MKVCHNPVETDIEFKILGKIYSKQYSGDQDFLLQSLSINQYEWKAYLLNVNVKPLSNGDRKITVSSQSTFYLFKVKNRNTRKMCKICSKLAIKAMTSFWCFYCKLWTYFTLFSSVSVVNFEYVNIRWVVPISKNDFYSPKVFFL